MADREASKPIFGPYADLSSIGKSLPINKDSTTRIISRNQTPHNSVDHYLLLCLAQELLASPARYVTNHQPNTTTLHCWIAFGQRRLACAKLLSKLLDLRCVVLKPPPLTKSKHPRQSSFLKGPCPFVPMTPTSPKPSQAKHPTPICPRNNPYAPMPPSRALDYKKQNLHPSNCFRSTGCTIKGN